MYCISAQPVFASLVVYAHCSLVRRATYSNFITEKYLASAQSFDLLNDIIMNSLTFLFVHALIEILCFQQSNIILLMLWRDGK